MNSGGTTALVSSASALLAAVDGLLDASLTPHSDEEFIEVMRVVETAIRALEAVKHRFTVETGTRCLAARAGVSTPVKFLEQTLRLSHAEATGRWNTAKLVSPRVFPTGELDPILPLVAEAQRAGAISADHTRHIVAALHKLPDTLPDERKETAERILTDYARAGLPDALPRLGNEILIRVHPDGELAAERDRQRLRGLSIGHQRVNGMSPVSGEITPALRAVLDPMLAKWARPGVCNPEDTDSPRSTADAADRGVLAAAAKRDGRTAAQRNHDALLGFLRFGVDPAMLGNHRGLPVAAVLSMSVADVERGAGIATTATGGTLSVSEALKLAATASDSSTFVAVLDKAGAPIHLARVRRSSAGSRGKAARASGATPDSAGVGNAGVGGAGVGGAGKAGVGSVACGGAVLGASRGRASCTIGAMPGSAGNGSTANGSVASGGTLGGSTLSGCAGSGGGALTGTAISSSAASGTACGATPVTTRGAASAATGAVSASPAPGFTVTDLPLHLGENERLATGAQRLALIAAEKGCTRPGCTAPASLSAVHHITEWVKGGPTDIENLTLACDACHGLVHDGPGGWKTVVMGPDTDYPGHTGWIAPPHIDPTGTPQVNHRHHPGELTAATLARIHARDERERARLEEWLNTRNTSHTRR
ncbi:HNH endonuclease [Nocardia sp. NBC_01503]|uniref:HNH endonuclease signature motif containing protein n=1 Tax=Nocardia sp. NBC_01503 TaxID=2975997 RepID=UPI002E7B3DA7|nr:DUF222 domain-containing protein [Nocardia sp. NBC_01503]WTL33516.1 HNH endonuclease [Nocardia sp. NBC_01503]